MLSLQQAIDRVGRLDEEAMKAAQRRQDSLTKPLGSLGRLEELSTKVAGIRGVAVPALDRKAIVVMARLGYRPSHT